MIFHLELFTARYWQIIHRRVGVRLKFVKFVLGKGYIEAKFCELVVVTTDEGQSR